MFEPNNSSESQDKANLAANNYSAIYSNNTLYTVLIVSAVICTILGFFYTWPHYNEYRTAKNSVIELQNALKTKESRLALAIEETKTKTPDDEEKALKTAIPSQIDVPNLIREIDSISKLSSQQTLDNTILRTFSINLSTQQKEAKFKTANIQASFSSYTLSLIKLLQEFESDSHRIYNIKSINISLSNTPRKTEGLLSPAKDEIYKLLLDKRRNFMLSPEETEKLDNIQHEVEQNYLDLKKKPNLNEQEQIHFKALSSEIQNIKTERSYELSIETYFTS